MANVDESVANIDVCGRFCGSCPTYAANNLKAGKPSLLFCGRADPPNPRRRRRKDATARIVACTRGTSSPVIITV